MGVEELSHLHVVLLDAELDPEVIVQEDPLVVRKLDDVHH